MNCINEHIDINDWKEYLVGEELLEDVEFIRKRTLSGRVCGPAEFVEELERKCGIKLRWPNMGRPRN